MKVCDLTIEYRKYMLYVNRVCEHTSKHHPYFYTSVNVVYHSMHKKEEELRP
jgi:hypothetical protein